MVESLKEKCAQSFDLNPPAVFKKTTIYIRLLIYPNVIPMNCRPAQNSKLLPHFGINISKHLRKMAIATAHRTY